MIRKNGNCVQTLQLFDQPFYRPDYVETDSQFLKIRAYEGTYISF